MMKPTKRIYCDHAATTPVAPEVSRAMKKASAIFANPSSLHKDGRAARQNIEVSRAEVARFIGAHPNEIVFTSGGTEANNIAIFGACVALPKPLSSYHAVTTAIEHASVLEVFHVLERKGLSVTYVGVDERGHVSVKDVVGAIRENTVIVSVMHANNEIGTIQPIADIGRGILKIRKEKGGVYPLFHTDACQSTGLLPIVVSGIHADMLSISFSKLYGPKGLGVLFVRREAPIGALFAGGGHERGLRPGTENMPAIVGAAEAVRMVERMCEKEYKRLSGIREFFLASLARALPRNSYHVNGGEPACRQGREVMPHIVNISFIGCDAEEMLFRLDAAGISVGTKSACQSEDEGLSYVVKALGETHDAKSAVRFSFGRATTKKDISCIVRAIKNAHTLTSHPSSQRLKIKD